MIRRGTSRTAAKVSVVVSSSGSNSEGSVSLVDVLPLEIVYMIFFYLVPKSSKVLIVTCKTFCEILYKKYYEKSNKELENYLKKYEDERSYLIRTGRVLVPRFDYTCSIWKDSNLMDLERTLFNRRIALFLNGYQFKFQWEFKRKGLASLLSKRKPSTNASDVNVSSPFMGHTNKQYNAEEVKIVICGPSGGGKSPISIQFIQNHFVDEYDPGIEDSYRKLITLSRTGQAILIDLLDTTGMEDYAAMRDQYMRTSEGFMYVFAVNDLSHFEEVHTFREQTLRVKDTYTVPMILVGNKCDLVTERQVPREEAESVAKSWNCQYIETSAKTGYNIAECFELLTEEVLRHRYEGTDETPDKKLMMVQDQEGCTVFYGTTIIQVNSRRKRVDTKTPATGEAWYNSKHDPVVMHYYGRFDHKGRRNGYGRIIFRYPLRDASTTTTTPSVGLKQYWCYFYQGRLSGLSGGQDVARITFDGRECNALELDSVLLKCNKTIPQISNPIDIRTGWL